MTRTHDCPSCAATLRIPDEHERFFTCDHCGTVIEDVGSADEVTLAVAPSSRSAPDAPPGDSRVVAGVVVSVLVMGAVLVFLQVQSDQSGQGAAAAVDGATTITSVSGASLVSSDDDTSPDLVVSARRAGDAAGSDATLVYLDEEAEDGRRWEAPSVDARSGAIVVGDDVVVVSSGDRLVVHDRRSGATRSELRPSDDVQHAICATCVRLFGSTIVALSGDGVLAAVEPDEAVLLWERRLTGTPRQVLDVGGVVGVVDEGVVDGEPGVLLLDPVTGEQVGTMPVACTPDPGGRAGAVGVFDQLHEVDGGLVLLSQVGSRGCAARWEPGTSEPAWETAVEFDHAADLTVDTVVRHRSLLLHAEGGLATAVDVDTGAVTELARSEEHDLTPWFVSDDMLVLAAESSRGTGGWALWGIDLESAEHRWTHELAAETALQLDPARRAADAWFAIPTTEGVTVGTMRQSEGSGEAPVILTLQTLPARAGTAGASTTVELPPSLIPSALVAGVHGDALHLTYETGVWTVDTTTGSARQRL